MVEETNDKFSFLFDTRNEKPRDEGVTFVLGDTLMIAGRNTLEDLVEWGGEWIDWYKVVYSSLPFQPPELLEHKIELLNNNDIQVFPGGNFLEAAVIQGFEQEFLESVKAVGCDRVEVSTTVVDLPSNEKTALIEQASDMGLEVHSEIGKKKSEGANMMTSGEIIGEMEADLNAGADKVILETEEVEEILMDSGTIQGDIDPMEEINEYIDEIGLENIIFELPISADFAPLKASAWFINNLGSEVNLGNVLPNQILMVEQQRRNIGPYTYSDDYSME